MSPLSYIQKFGHGALKARAFAGAILAFAFFGGACEDSPTIDGDEGDDSRGSGAESSTGGVGSSAGGGDGGGDDGDIEVVSSGGSDKGLGGADACAESSDSAVYIPANLLFVVDKSGSMKCNPPPLHSKCANEPIKEDESLPSKWEITQQALTGDTGALPTLAGQVGISVGLITFPLDDHCEVPGDGEVTVPISPLSEAHLADVQAGLNIEPAGQTPLAGAAIRGLEAIRQGIHAGELEGKNYLVIMTDGAETCQEGALDDLLSFVDEAKRHYDIKTFAIGAPGSEASRGLLSEIAYLGGTSRADDCEREPQGAAQSCHIDLTESDDFEADLGEVFRGIAETTSQCEFDVPEDALIDLSTVNVEFTEGDGSKHTVGRDEREDGTEQCEGAEGWQFSEDETKIHLCGQTCADYLADPEAKVRVVFGCKPTEIR